MTIHRPKLDRFRERLAVGFFHDVDRADVPEWARLWIWEEDREGAVARLGVVGA